MGALCCCPSQEDLEEYASYPNGSLYQHCFCVRCCVHRILSLINRTGQKVGGIIGRKGEFVKKMCEETKSCIKILDGVSGILDRVVMISAKDEPDVAVSPAMDGVLKVHKHIIEGIDAMTDSGRGQQSVVGSISTWMLLPRTQYGRLIGKQGSTIKSIQEGSGRVLGPGERCCLNSELWHACAGPPVSLPAVKSRVLYFPQGHSKQVAASTNKEVDAHIPNYPNLPPQLVCQLHNDTMHASFYCIFILCWTH